MVVDAHGAVRVQKAESDLNMSGPVDGRLAEHRRLWDAKPTLRSVYADYHRRLEAACPAGRLLDIGGGSAHFKAYRNSVISLDILPFPGIDVVADAHQMPFPAGHFAGIVMLDVLHHLQWPLDFFREAARVLEPRGRVAMIEPGMSVVARQIYQNFHQEPVKIGADPFAEGVRQSGDDPFDSNQALPTLLFGTPQARARFEQSVPELKVVSNEWLSLIVYPLSGGFKPWSLWPSKLAKPALRVEQILLPVLGPLLAFRLMTVLERSG
jgi:SAM-dependent methyltransferase